MIQIIDYGAGNLRSVQNALKQLGVKSKVISSAENLNPMCKTIFPGVGAAGSAMRTLKERGFTEAIQKIKAPFLGICLGMQLLMDFSEENNTQCLGLIAGKVRKFPKTVKIPQIGWNKVSQTSDKTNLFKDIPDRSYFYFVNSYYVDLESPGATVDYRLTRCQPRGLTAYGINFASVINKENFYGVQFHPEKSGEIGLKLLNNFCELC